MRYDRVSITSPTLAGTKLLFAAWLMERGPIGRRLAPVFFRALGVDRFRELRVTEPPWYHPVVPPTEDASPERRHKRGFLGAGSTASETDRPAPDIDLLETIGTTRRPTDGFAFPSVADYARSYRDGSVSPEEVARRIVHVLEHQDRGDPPLYAFISWNAEQIIAAAKESAQRLAEGTARSIFEGVPIAVKDEIDVAGYPTTVGTSFLTQQVCTEDAWLVARLREAGAVIVGKTNMHEIGIGVTGLNPFHGTPVNPYAPWRYPGGSSSGSASAVASGICPVSMGCDGGGSVRIPAAYCGVFGLKVTMGRISGRGEFPLAESVANAGPIAGNVRDLALAYLTVAGTDPHDVHTEGQPTPTLDRFLDDVEGLRIGVYTDWFNDAREEVVGTNRRLLEMLRERGAQIIEIEIPELDSLRVAHLVTITTEMRAALEPWYRDHVSDFGNEARANLALARFLTVGDYIKAQRIRRRLFHHFERAFQQVDLIATPTTANLTPRLHRDRLLSGVSDLKSLTETMRFVVAANLLGYPAVTVPSGFVTARSRRFWHTVDETDENGDVYSQVPVGLQFMARHWREALLLRAARVCEELVVRPRPRVYMSPFEVDAP